MSIWGEEAESSDVGVFKGLGGITVGVVSGVTSMDLPVVSWDQGAHETAASTAWGPQPPVWGDCLGLRVVLAFAEADQSAPIVLCLLDAPPQVDAPSTSKPKSVRIESEEELVIECGKAKIALRADGRIEIRGGHLVSRSSGPNKIKGATVHIN